MINPLELQLGSWVYAESGFPMYVVGLYDDVVYLDFEGNEADWWEEEFKELEPIPLTEKILERMGFEEYKPGWFRRETSTQKICFHLLAHTLYVKRGVCYQYSWTFDGYWTFENILYLHQFQSALTTTIGWQPADKSFNDDKVFRL